MTNMNIAFDSFAIHSNKDRGIGRYTICHIEELAKDNPSVNFFYFNFFDERHVGKYIKEFSNIKEINIDISFDYKLINNNYYSNLFGSILSYYLKKNDITIFYATSPMWDSVLYEKKWFNDVFLCGTFYDLIPWVLKDICLRNIDSEKQYLKYLENLRSFDHLFSIFNSAKSDLDNYFNGAMSNKITAIHGAPNNYFQKQNLDKILVLKVLEKFSIKNNRKYIISVAGDDPRKNIEKLIQAYSLLASHIKEEHQLVVVCKLSQQSMNHYSSILEELSLKQHVILTNFVTDEELLVLYNNAYISVFVSLYEGLGLPILESYACDLPVVTSNVSSLNEIAKDVSFTVNPYDIKDIAKGLTECVCMSDIERRKMIKHQKSILSRYTWKNASSITTEILYNLRDQINKKKNWIIAFFTPLPPIPSGISDYSVDILNEISKYFLEIHVYIDSGYRYNSNLPSNVKVFEHTCFDAKKYDEIIYQVGNSEFHKYMIDYVKRYSGIVVLHDANLKGLLQYIANSDVSAKERYADFLREDFSDTDVGNILKKEANGIYPSYVLNGLFVNYAKKVIVHSETAMINILENHFDADVYKIPLYTVIRDKISGDYDDKNIVISAYGMIQGTKRNLQSLKACCRLWNEGFTFKLLFVGKVCDSSMNSLINEILENNNIVKNNFLITGFVELDEFMDYLEKTDIVLNFRYPYNGENSGSLSRAFGMGKCVLVNNIGSFAEIPDDSCVKLESVEHLSEEDEVQMIYNNIKMLLLNPMRISDIGEKALNYAKLNWDLTLVGQKYRDVIYNDRFMFFKRDLVEFSRHHSADKEMLINFSKQITKVKFSDLW